MAAIVVDDLRKTFLARQRSSGRFGALRDLLRPVTRPVSAVDGVSFSVESGELVAFLGPNGAGESTTIKMLTGAAPLRVRQPARAEVVTWS